MNFYRRIKWQKKALYPPLDSYARVSAEIIEKNLLDGVLP
jgi:hypothetical protein